MSFRSNSYSMTKKNDGFDRSDLLGGTRDRPLIIPLETVKSFPKKVPNIIDIDSVTGVHDSANLCLLSVKEGGS